MAGAGVATSATAGEPGLVVEAREVLASPELKGVSAELLAIVTDDIVEAALAEVKREGIGLLIAGADGTLGENAAARRITERILQFSPCDTIAIDTGEDDGTGFERVLVPYSGRFRTHALQMAASLAHGNSGVAVPFLVGTFFGKDSEDVAMRELAREVEEAGIEEEELVSPLIDVSSKPLSSIVSRSRDCDLVLVRRLVDRRPEATAWNRRGRRRAARGQADRGCRHPLCTFGMAKHLHPRRAARRLPGFRP